MIVDRNILKSWFKRFMRPSEEQFAAWIDSYYHVNDNIPIDAVDKLSGILDAKIDKLEIDNVVNNITDKLQLERRLTFTAQSDSYTMLIAEPMTIYRVDYIGLDYMEISLDNGQTWQVVGLNDNINIDRRMLVTFRFVYMPAAVVAYIYLFAKVKL